MLAPSLVNTLRYGSGSARRGRPTVGSSDSSRGRPRTRCTRPRATSDRADTPPPCRYGRRRSRRRPRRPFRTRSRAVPGWQPVAEQQPFVHVAWHEPSMHVWFEQTNCPSHFVARLALVAARVLGGAVDAGVTVAAALARVRDRTAPCTRPRCTSRWPSRSRRPSRRRRTASEVSPFSHLSSRQQPRQFAGVHVTAWGSPVGTDRAARVVAAEALHDAVGRRRVDLLRRRCAR